MTGRPSVVACFTLLIVSGLLATSSCTDGATERRPLEKTYDDGVTVRVRGEEMLLDGEWVMDGPITFFRNDGNKQAEGSYRNGLESGAWTEYLKDGTRAEGAYLEGKRQGPWTYWHRAGTKQEEGEYDQGERIGRWTLWSEKGALREENDYLDGEVVRRSYRENGELDPGRSGVFVEGEWVRPLPK